MQHINTDKRPTHPSKYLTVDKEELTVEEEKGKCRHKDCRMQLGADFSPGREKR